MRSHLRNCRHAKAKAPVFSKAGAFSYNLFNTMVTNYTRR